MHLEYAINNFVKYVKYCAINYHLTYCITSHDSFILLLTSSDKLVHPKNNLVICTALSEMNLTGAHMRVHRFRGIN